MLNLSPVMVAETTLEIKYKEKENLLNSNVIDINEYSELKGQIYFLEEYLRCRK